MTEKIGILALGHGSRHPHNKEVVSGVADLIAKKYKDVVVRIGFMNMNTPTMKEGLDGFKGTGVSKIVAVPIFLAHGVHTMEDIPQILGISKESRKTMIKIDGKDVALIYSEPLGVDELVAELAYKRVNEAISSN
ncbi:MAG: sirohydrochlorin nickelochelatase [Candidatus Methanoperedens sp.]|uniref:sirohydrochlorin nickelochelatase n=1 Tax=Candidatus Methanoperedens sp. BLZ2 TaxID=2035255 RepID=UPI000BE3412C|nr:sirohydrochlorin nickelochelatase [Candidatus Methanoperedens sp. BLZ2]KAB2942182.1 MAG: sirohydrochlorin nickelochelatase [Candidatus Methanoperedens sp.]MBZ0173671.1 sirohydrochlorin nickelochelatase [Candidatus Methanoperedens nitroreducens]MCX9076347.1 sirohydrochlorin nickelochelatase [Candidatus Methanoperedens sp.]